MQKIGFEAIKAVLEQGHAAGATPTEEEQAVATAQSITRIASQALVTAAHSVQAANNLRPPTANRQVDADSMNVFGGQDVKLNIQREVGLNLE